MSKFNDLRWNKLLFHFANLQTIVDSGKYHVEYDDQKFEILEINHEFKEVYFVDDNCLHCIFCDEEEEKRSASAILKELRKRIKVFLKEEIAW